MVSSRSTKSISSVSSMGNQSEIGESSNRRPDRDFKKRPGQSRY